MGSIQPEDSFLGRWVRQIYTEAFRRVGVPVDIAVLPVLRLSLMADRGEIDGDVARVHGYGAAHPELTRVEQPVMEAQRILYGVEPGWTLKDAQALVGSTRTAVFVRGVSTCETLLKAVLPPAQVVDVSSDVQALNMVLGRRTDLFCTSDVGLQGLLSRPEFRHVNGLHAVLDAGTQPYYPYLHRRHAALAPLLAAALRQMKEEGLINRYRAESLAAASRP
jgi:polar amino acid transport system substrate-binding protein